MSISIKKQTGSGAKVKKRLSDASNSLILWVWRKFNS